MNTAYILLGSNEGDRLFHLSKALELIEQNAGVVVKRSKVYITVAWGYQEQPDFLNQVVCIETMHSPQQLLKQLLGIEQTLGRTRTDTKWRQRIIDLDILFYNELVLKEESLCIPHPFIQDRKFVLVPLLEIAATLVHPVFRKDMATLTQECQDTLEVRKLEKEMK